MLRQCYILYTIFLTDPGADCQKTTQLSWCGKSFRSISATVSSFVWLAWGKEVWGYKEGNAKILIYSTFLYIIWLLNLYYLHINISFFGAGVWYSFAQKVFEPQRRIEKPWRLKNLEAVRRRALSHSKHSLCNIWGWPLLPVSTSCHLCANFSFICK